MPDEPELNFEQALAQIERIVVNLERGEPDLTAALARYEEGVRMLTLCYRLIDRAEQSAALLTGVDQDGNPVSAPFDATATIDKDIAPGGSPARRLTARESIDSSSEPPPRGDNRPIPFDNQAEPPEVPF